MREPVSHGQWVILTTLTCVAAFLHLGHIQLSLIEDPIRNDAREYAAYASNLRHHGVFSRQSSVESAPVPDAYRGPGYPALLAVGMWIADDEYAGDGFYRIVCLIQAVLGIALTPLAFAIARRLLPNRWALVPAGLTAICPHLVIASGTILTEGLYAFALTASLLAFLRALRSGRRAAYAVAGVAFGLAYLVNATIGLLPLLLAGITVARDPATRRDGLSFARSGPALMLAVFVLLAGGWSLRAMVSVPAEARGGRVLGNISHGSYPDFTYQSEAYRFYPYREDPEQPEIARSPARFASVFWERFKARPADHVYWYVFQKPSYFWSWNILQGVGDIYVYPVARSFYDDFPLAGATLGAMRGLHGPVVLLAMLALVISVVEGIRTRSLPKSAPALVLLTLVYFTALNFLFFPLPRYAIPLRPLLYIAATWSLWSILGADETGRALSNAAAQTTRNLQRAKGARIMSTTGPDLPAPLRRWEIAVALGALLLIAASALTGAGRGPAPLVAAEGATTMEQGLQLLREDGNPAAAAVVFRRVLAANPDHYGAKYQLATALETAGLLGEAVDAWRAFVTSADEIRDSPNAEHARRRLAALGAP